MYFFERCVNELGSYRCYCAPGWTGSTCAKAIDYCLSQPCNRNGTCISRINGFECQCLSSYTGDVCQYDIDECLANPCLNNGTCYNYIGGFHCRCPRGYFGMKKSFFNEYGGFSLQVVIVKILHLNVNVFNK